MELDNYEATSTFTSVTTQIVAHPAIRGFVDGLQKATFPSPPAIQATGLPALTLAGLPPASACGPSLGTQLPWSDPKITQPKLHFYPGPPLNLNLFPKIDDTFEEVGLSLTVYFSPLLMARFLIE